MRFIYENTETQFCIYLLPRFIIKANILPGIISSHHLIARKSFHGLLGKFAELKKKNGDNNADDDNNNFYSPIQTASFSSIV